MPAYNINKSNGDPVTVPEGGIDTQFDIPLIGQNSTNYGDDVAVAYVRLLENFANNSAPSFGSSRTTGQLWYDTGTSTLKVWNGASWDSLSTQTGGATSFSGDILPDSDNLYDVGSAALSWAEVHANNFFVDGNITAVDGTEDIGSSGTPFADVYATTFHGTATTAQYADLAERYAADAEYVEGTVVKLGGEKEVTATTEERDLEVFGVVSNDPGFGLNATAGEQETHPYVAIAGRVPVRAIGKVKKGQRLVTSYIPGVAMAADLDGLNPFAVIGRAIEAKDSEEEATVLVAVGAK